MDFKFKLAVLELGYMQILVNLAVLFVSKIANWHVFFLGHPVESLNTNSQPIFKDEIENHKKTITRKFCSAPDFLVARFEIKLLLFSKNLIKDIKWRI